MNIFYKPAVQFWLTHSEFDLVVQACQAAISETKSKKSIFHILFGDKVA